MRRGRSLALVSFASLFGAGAHADTHLGVFGGAGFTSLHQTNRTLFYSADYENAARAAAGLSAEIAVGSRFALRFEPSYAGRGAEFVDPACTCLRPVGYVPARNDLRLDYVDLPVLFVAPLGHGRRRPFVDAGAIGSYLVHATNHRAGVASNETPYLHRWDVSPAAGVGVRLDRGVTRFTLEARYALGLVAVDDHSSRNRGLQVLAGVAWRTGRPSASAFAARAPAERPRERGDAHQQQAG